MGRRKHAPCGKHRECDVGISKEESRASGYELHPYSALKATCEHVGKQCGSWGAWVADMMVGTQPSCTHSGTRGNHLKYGFVTRGLREAQRADYAFPLGVSLCKGVLEEISIRSGALSKAEGLLHCGWASSNQLMV